MGIEPESRVWRDSLSFPLFSILSAARDLPFSVTALVLSTGNAHKLAEVQQILGEEYSVRGLDSLPPFPAVEESSDTFEGNASLKAEAASKLTESLVIADDSGLEVDALGGEPGVRSARYSGPGATDAKNNDLLLQKLASVRGKDRSARFRCVLAVARGGKTLAHFSGAVEGIIINQPRGREGFGYDPLFVPAGHCQTFAELGSDVKNTLSHRARALDKLRAWLAENC
jgi:XTP/dITP diphosphohydrolase